MKYDYDRKYCDYCKKEQYIRPVDSGDIVCYFCGSIVIKKEEKRKQKMKIRNGFVSNSSSSSFIIGKCKKFPNVKALAKHMLKIRDKEWADWDDLGHNREKENLKNITKADKNLTFRTTNYETWLIDDGDYIVVSTCNNHDWSSLYDHIQYPKDIMAKHDVRGDYCNIENNGECYDLNCDVRGVPYKPNNWMPLKPLKTYWDTR